MRKSHKKAARMGAPFLHRAVSIPELFDTAQYPFNIPAFSQGIDLEFRSKVTFFVGENGSGKSTLLETWTRCLIFARTADDHSMRSRTANRLCRYSPIDSSKASTFWTNLRRRCHRNDSCHFSGSFTTSPRPDMRSF